MTIDRQNNESAHLFLTRGSCDKVKRIQKKSVGCDDDDDDDDEDNNKNHSFEKIC